MTRDTLVFRALTPRLVEALGTVLRGSWGAGCWRMYPRLTDAETRALPRIVRSKALMRPAASPRW